MSNKKLLVTDYDNTFEMHCCTLNCKEILKKNIISINKFMMDNLVCIATGRHFDAIYKTLLDNGIVFNFLCANNGAELYDNNYKLLYCLPLDEKDLKKLYMFNDKIKIFFRTPYKSSNITSANIYEDNLKCYNEIKACLKKN